MIYPMHQTSFRVAKKQGFLVYDNSIFLHDLIMYLQHHRQDVWLIFLPKPTIVYHPNLQTFIKDALVLIQSYYSDPDNTPPRHHVYIPNQFPNQDFIKQIKADYWVNPHQPDSILIHQSNVDFINKYKTGNPTSNKIKKQFWKQSWNHLQPNDQLTCPRQSIHIFNSEDHLFLNPHIVADMINQLNIDFSFSNHSNISTSLSHICHLDSRFYTQKLRLLLTRELTCIFGQI